MAESGWTAARREHEARVDVLLEPHRQRRRAGVKHPVEDFLFEYYSLRPALLRRWHPGHGVVLAGAGASDWLRFPHYTRVDGGVTVDTAGVIAKRGDTIRWVRSLLAATAGRPAFLGCFGLHEWAMVYRPADGTLRHDLPLRLGVGGTARVVEQREIRCGHYDAFRFFTPAAVPRNAVQPTRADQIALEQPGCLHANMDLYKWAYKLSPLVSSDLLLSCFILARDIRVLDMRAGPYDLSALGYDPVRVETAAGRAEYAAAQREFSDRAGPLRERLLADCPAVPGG